MNAMNGNLKDSYIQWSNMNAYKQEISASIKEKVPLVNLNTHSQTYIYPQLNY